MDSIKLSVIIPVYNEENTIFEILNQVCDQEVVSEILVIDDCSSDRSSEIIRSYSDQRIKYFKHQKNLGKGAAISLGLKEFSGDYVLIQDADLEYSPYEYEELLEPIREKKADAVFGSRFMSGKSRRVLYYWHSLGNHFLTTLSNIFTNLDLTDMETCFKLMSHQVGKALRLEENRFGIEPELTAQIAAMRVKIFEVAVSYNGRTYADGKKITWKDGFSAIRCIIKYNLPYKKRRYLSSYLSLESK
jgi:glycosyltransferase involved in cell wall biosynthesis